MKLYCTLLKRKLVASVHSVKSVLLKEILNKNSYKKMFSNFCCRFLNSNNFFQFELQFFFNLLDLRNIQEQVKKALCFKNCTDLPLFEKKNLLKFEAEGKKPRICKIFEITRTITIKIGKNYWDLETCRKSQKNIFFRISVKTDKKNCYV